MRPLIPPPDGVNMPYKSQFSFAALTNKQLIKDCISLKICHCEREHGSFACF
jgi:hypothetical protein